QTARLTHRLADGVAGDLVEHHAVHVLTVEVAALLEDLLQVPGDGLAFAVRVGGQIERLGLAQAARDRLHAALVFFQHPVLHGVAVVGIDRAFLGNQIAHVAIGGEHVEIAPQVFFDGLRLGGRLDDDQVLCHDLKNARSQNEKPRASRGALKQHQNAPRVQCGALRRTSVMSPPSCSTASSCPGWLESTISTTHLSVSVSDSSLSRASMRSITSSRCCGVSTCAASSFSSSPRHSVDRRASSLSLNTRPPRGAPPRWTLWAACSWPKARSVSQSSARSTFAAVKPTRSRSRARCSRSGTSGGSFIM